MSDLLPRHDVNVESDSCPAPTGLRPRLRRPARRRWAPTPALARLLAALALLAFLAVAGPARSAPVQWPVSEGGNGHYYEWVPAGRTPSITWTEARDEAAAASFMGVAGHLATITSDAESQFLGSQFRNSSFQLWIGGVQATGAATPASGWTWITGEPWDFTSWNAGEPNDWPTQNVEDGQEQYLSMTPFVTGGRGATVWNDNTPRGVPSSYLVEYPVLPEPASAALMGLAAGVLLTRRPRREQAASHTSVATAPSGR
jgi:hypothetical protein